MRRFAKVVTKESHPLFKVFMRDISNAIFLWDEEDVKLLIAGKRINLLRQGMVVRHLTDKEIRSRFIHRQEMLQHCRRRTQPVDEITKNLDTLVIKYKSSYATDMLGRQLVNPQELDDVWNEQKRHVPCIADVKGIPLYLKVGEMQVGPVKVPIYRCGRGTTSLENFHKHVIDFIPGSSAGAASFQAYLLSGIQQWNVNRKNQRCNVQRTSAYAYDEDSINIMERQRRALSKEVMYPHYEEPSKATGQYSTRCII